jgi:hypothetical protein
MAFIEVTGVVDRVIYDSKGFAIIETFQVKGETKTRRYTAWFDAAQTFNEGDTISVRGIHSAKVSEWTDKEGKVRHNAEVAINNSVAKLVESGRPELSADAPF